jgi:hypothetical protein
MAPVGSERDSVGVHYTKNINDTWTTFAKHFIRVMVLSLAIKSDLTDTNDKGDSIINLA